MRKLISLFIIIAVAITPVTAKPALMDSSLPDIASRADALLSKQQQYDLGRAWLRSLRSQAPILTDPIVQSWYEHIVWKLLPYSQLSDPRLELVMVDTTDINAFAVPGGIIGLNAGTILNADNIDEVAAVLSHELAHISQHHFARRYDDSRNVSRSVLLALLASIALAASGSANAGMAGIAATQAAAIQSQLSYTRHQEAEADRIGMTTLSKAGYDTDAMPAFFEKLLRMERYNGEPLQFLIDHPATETRVADTRSRVRLYPQKSPHISTDFLLVQARLKARYLQDDQYAERYFKERYQRQTDNHKLAAGYGLALVYLRAQKTQAALDLLQQLQKNTSRNWWLELAKGEAYMAASQFDQANTVFARLYKLLPRDYPVAVYYAQSLLLSKQANKAQEILREQLDQRRQDPLLWELYARSLGAQKDNARAHLARGEFLFLNGHSAKAKQQLKYALDQSKSSFSLHSSIQARLEEMELADKQKF